MFDLEQTDGDTFVGRGPRYRWGGLFGGQIVAQALRAATMTVDGLLPHSFRAYFIRRGDHTEPVRYEVDRIRNGRSFATRRVVAHQATGAILNLEASFHGNEASPDVQTVPMPTDVEGPETRPNSSWTEEFDRREVHRRDGRAAAWMRATGDLSNDPLLHMSILAFISDDLPTDSVLVAHPDWRTASEESHEHMFAASLDHTIWFHRPYRADEWHLYDMTCHGFTSGRGLSIGHVFRHDGTHIATVAQEVLLRDNRNKPNA